jgi:cytochrome oxidase Cu insertion factor (SCO1/SenC/PrrC family)
MNTNNKRMLLLIVSLCFLITALVFIALSSTVHYKLSGFYGLRTQTHLDLPETNIDGERLRLILPIFKECANSCPANLMLARRIVNDYRGTLRLVLMPIKPDDGSARWIERIGKQIGGKVDILGTDFPASRTLLAKYERLQSPSEQQPQHAGFLYLYQPSSESLLTYTAPTLATIVSDLDKLNHGANDGDKHIQLVTN